MNIWVSVPFSLMIADSCSHKECHCLCPKAVSRPGFHHLSLHPSRCLRPCPHHHQTNRFLTGSAEAGPGTPQHQGEIPMSCYPNILSPMSQLSQLYYQNMPDIHPYICVTINPRLHSLTMTAHCKALLWVWPPCHHTFPRPTFLSCSVSPPAVSPRAVPGPAWYKTISNQHVFVSSSEPNQLHTPCWSL